MNRLDFIFWTGERRVAPKKAEKLSVTEIVTRIEAELREFMFCRGVSNNNYLNLKSDSMLDNVKSNLDDYVRRGFIQGYQLGDNGELFIVPTHCVDYIYISQEVKL